MKQTCFDHNFSKSAPFGPSFAMVTQFEAFLKMQSIAEGPEQFGRANKENIRKCVLLYLLFFRGLGGGFGKCSYVRRCRPAFLRF